MATLQPYLTSAKYRKWVIIGARTAPWVHPVVVRHHCHSRRRTAGQRRTTSPRLGRRPYQPPPPRLRRCYAGGG